jgi:hypothetical protein
MTMTIGRIFYVIAAIVFFIGGIGSPIIPNAVVWGLFSLTLGLLLDGYDLGFRHHG